MWIERAPGILEGIPMDHERENDVFVILSNMPKMTKDTHRLKTFRKRAGVIAGYDAALRFGYDNSVLPFLTLLGTVGTGKTHLALAIGWEWLCLGKTVLYHHVADFLNALRSGYGKKSGEEDYSQTISFAKNCSLLILDDMGTERETEWATEQLDLIVDYRYERHKALLITSNMALTQLSPRIADRLREGTIVQLKGESYRKQKR